MPIVTGKVKIKVPENAKPGDEVEIPEASVDITQENYERPLAERFARMARQTQKLEDTEAQLATMKAELEKAKAGGTKDDKAGKPSESEVQLKAQLDQLNARLAEKELKERIDTAFKKFKAAEIPDQFRAAIRLETNATPEEVELAVREQVDAFSKLKTDLGVKETNGNGAAGGNAGGNGAGNFGAAGNGGTKDDPNDPGKAAIQKIMASGKSGYIEMLKSAPAEKQAEIAQAWITSGVLNPPVKK